VIPGGAVVAVVAVQVVGRVQASRTRFTAIIGAGIQVVAICWWAAKTLARDAGVTHRAGISVTAIRRIRDVGAAGQRLAGIIGARVEVIARQSRVRCANAGAAMVSLGTDVAVIARGVVPVEHTSFNRVAAIVGANVAVGAVERCAGDARALTAHIAHGAKVFVGTRIPIVSRPQGAFAGGRVAYRVQAHRVGSRLGVIANYRRVGDDGTLVREVGLVTEEGAVAQVVVFQLGAICVLLAVAIYEEAVALSILALVGHGTGVAIIAGKGVWSEKTAAGFGAYVIGARIGVVANYRGPHALPFFAVVPYRTGVAVGALHVGQVLVAAALLVVATVLGTWIVIVAQVDVVAGHLRGLVDISIAVVVDAVAAFGRRHPGVAFGEPVLGTHSHPFASAKIIGYGARRPQRPGYRFLGAGAGTGVGHALGGDNAIDGFHLQARKSPRTVLTLRRLSITSSATEVSILSITHADVLRDRGFAVRSRGAWAAQIGVV